MEKTTINFNRTKETTNKNNAKMVEVTEVEGTTPYEDKSLPEFYCLVPLFDCEGKLSIQMHVGILFS